MPTACPTQCNQGQGRCFLRQGAGDACCNFYLQNNCIEECPSGLVSDSNSVCGKFYYAEIEVQCGIATNLSVMYKLYCLTHTVCHPLTLGNGTVSYSKEMGVERNIGSVATHTCISGYRLLMQDGGNTRTCNISGWSSQDFICGEWCECINIGIVILSFNVIMITALCINNYCLQH